MFREIACNPLLSIVTSKATLFRRLLSRLSSNAYVGCCWFSTRGSHGTRCISMMPGSRIFAKHGRFYWPTADQGPLRKAVQHPEDFEHIGRFWADPGFGGTDHSAHLPGDRWYLSLGTLIARCWTMHLLDNTAAP